MINLVDNKEDFWAERGNYWIKKLNPVPQYKARKRRVIHRPLVLSGHGIRLNIDYGTIVIKCGYTHHPQKQEKYRFFPRDRQLPSRIVILDGDGSITFDALEWLSEQNVPLVQINWRGEVASVGGVNYSAEPDLMKHQLEVRNNTKGFEFSKWLILRKIENCYKTIKYISNNAPEVQLILEKINEQANVLKEKLTLVVFLTVILPFALLVIPLTDSSSAFNKTISVVGFALVFGWLNTPLYWGYDLLQKISIATKRAAASKDWYKQFIRAGLKTVFLGVLFLFAIYILLPSLIKN